MKKTQKLKDKEEKVKKLKEERINKRKWSKRITDEQEDELNMQYFLEKLKKSNEVENKQIGNFRIKVIILVSTVLRSGFDGDKLAQYFLPLASPLFAQLMRFFFCYQSASILHSELYTLFESVVVLSRAKMLDGLTDREGMQLSVQDTEDYSSEENDEKEDQKLKDENS
ncbi:MAG: hypothetical protein EZS28_013914 [Streblomastix strix]|uniref:Uncharacterized protein n=1 Tax=Streblomastix strix TaxID=222440 RepID=A0A5J4W6L8_9EUKA|nr:MAG: hypothetical protein EZS28_013914 [Streblomastix strix]